MDFSWTEEQLQFRREVVNFARQSLQDDLISRDRQGLFAPDLWKKCAGFGIQALAAPKKYGGKEDDIDILTGMLAMEGLGYGCRDNGLAFGLNAQMWTVQFPLSQFGSEYQKKKFLPALVNGEIIGAHALTEKDAGSDIFNMKMTATRTGEGYLLNGQKRLVTFAPVANVVLVMANVNPDLGKWGVTAFLVENSSPGFSASDARDKMGLRTVPFGELNFEDCFVPVEHRLGAEGAGFSLMNFSLEYERCCILASHLGAMERQLEEAIDFTRERKQFGQPISRFQSVSNRIVQMKLRLETARLLLYKVAWLKKEGKPAMMEAALLKLHLSESFVDSSLDAIRTYGGNGYLSEFNVERDLRDAVGGILYAGTSDIQRNIVARLLGM